MGEANRRGTYQQRREKAVKAAAEVESEWEARRKERLELRAAIYANKKESLQWLAAGLNDKCNQKARWL